MRCIGDAIINSEKRNALDAENVVKGYTQQ